MQITLSRYRRFLISTLVGSLTFFASVQSPFDTIYGQEDRTESRLNQPGALDLTDVGQLKIGNASYLIKYRISGENQLEGIKLQRDNITLAAKISAVSDGALTIDLPRKVIDSKIRENVDDDYAVFVDGQFVPYDEIANDTQSRTLRINFGNGSEQIEITGTHVVPEFGTLAALILGISIVGVVVITRLKKSQQL